MSGSDVELPVLVDLDQLKADARDVIAYHTVIRDGAQAEIDKAEKILAALSGKKTRGSRKPPASKAIVEKTYCQLLTVLGTHAYALDTLASQAGFSHSTVSTYTQAAEVRGHVTREKRGRKLKLRLTNDGMDYVTECDPKPNGNGDESMVGKEVFA